jgi:hypothetical protein
MALTHVRDMNRWEEFAQADPYFYIDIEFDRIRGMPDAIDRFYETGMAASDELLGEVRSVLPGHSLAVEIGCGAGRILMGTARHFANVRGVDVAPRMLMLLNQRAMSVGTGNIQGFLQTQGWDEPPGSADYAYSFHVFQHIDDASEISAYIKRIGRALGQAGSGSSTSIPALAAFSIGSDNSSPTCCSLVLSVGAYAGSAEIRHGSGAFAGSTVCRSSRSVAGCPRTTGSSSGVCSAWPAK